MAIKNPIANANMASLIRTDLSVSDLRGKMMVHVSMQRHSSEATPCVCTGQNRLEGHVAHEFDSAGARLTAAAVTAPPTANASVKLR